ncbi:MAG: family 10 glycosylhydrolase [Bacteroidota bacterium]
MYLLRFHQLGGVAVLTFMLCVNVAAQPYQATKRALRATWIASVVNIDWPSKPGLTAQEQQLEFIQLLDEQVELGMNAVIVQVRPVADTFYPSANEPWSQYLTGEQGKAPVYNPLQFMIEESHRRNLEFHAWFNPYRASMKEELDGISEKHPLQWCPEWFVPYGGRWYYDPGNREARAFVLDEIIEVVRHYDLDAVHFDDYFYPYKVAGEEFPDSLSHAFYGAGFDSKDDWRRDNVDFFVETLSRRIKEVKPYVKFGISPFGVWRNKDKDPLRGSDTQAGQTNYDDLYADVLKWLREDWIDYVTPQIYWHRGFDLAGYEVLSEWWDENAYGKHVYIGQGLYRVGNHDSWQDPAELPEQLRLNETLPSINGSMFFSAKHWSVNKLGIKDSIDAYYRSPALVPTMPWIDSEAPLSPDLVGVSGHHKIGVQLVWKDDPLSDEQYYAVYRFEGHEGGDIQEGAKIIAKVRRRAKQQQTYIDLSAKKGKKYTYAVTAVDRLHNESQASNAFYVKFKTFGGRVVAQGARLN